MRFLLAIMLALVIPGTKAMAKASADEALTDFDFVVAGLRTDYAGFPDKTAGEKLSAFEQEADTRRAVVAAQPEKLFEEVWKLFDWFKDGHLALEMLPGHQTEVPPPVFDPAKDTALGTIGRRLEVDETSIRKKRGRAGPEGIWETIDGGYKVAVVPDPSKQGSFVGVILASRAASWTTGQVKFELTPSGDGNWNAIFRLRDHSEQSGPANFRGRMSLLNFEGIGTGWRRIWPEPTVAFERLVPSNEFFLRPLSAETALLRLPNFHPENVILIDQLLLNNKALLERTPNLLIDLRQNSGGSDAAYSELMKWIYSRPIYSIGIEFRVSRANADGFDELRSKPEFPDTFRPMIDGLIAGMRQSPSNSWVSPDRKQFSITTQEEVRAFPKRVGILITGAGSSGDQFVLDARQSRKVTTFGGNTAGVIDYSNQLQRLTPSGKYWFKWPTSRSMRLPEEPLDNVGIAPDIRIADQDEDPIGFVQRWLERQVD